MTVTPEMILSPKAVWASRTRKESHVIDLMESFYALNKINRRGVNLYVENEQLYAIWQSAGVDQRKDMMKPDNSFHIAIIKSEMRAPKGDHTGEALRRLKELYPNDPRYQQLDVKVFLGGCSLDDIDNLRYLGNIDNKVAGIQLKVTFVDRMWQLHNHHVEEGVILTRMSKSSYRGPKVDMRKRNVGYLEERAKMWKIPIPTLRSCQVLAHITR